MSETKMKCRTCLERLHRVEGLQTDPEGIRSDYWCEECKVMYTCTKAGLSPRLVLRDRYEGNAKERIYRLLSRLLREFQP